MDAPRPVTAAALGFLNDWFLTVPSLDGVLRAAAFVGVAVVAGAALLRPFAAAHPQAVPAVAAVTVPCVLVTVGPPLAAFGAAALTLAAAMAQRRPRLACGLGAALTALLAAHAARGSLGGVLGAGLLAAAAAVLLGAATALATGARRRVPVRAAAAAAVPLVAAAAVAVAVPAKARPGVPVVRTGADDRASVLIVPHRPGWNLVRVPGPAEVGTDPGAPASAVRVPGAEGRWSMVWLAPGRGRVWIRRAGRESAVRVDTGTGTARSTITWNDGPECASAALGALAADRDRPLRGCPADGLDDLDAAALRSIVGFVAGRGVDSVVLRHDSSPRSREAVRQVRGEARRLGVAVTAEARPDRPVIIVSGWSGAHGVLSDVAAGRLRGSGTYLAPWLLAPRLLTVPAGQLLPLRFSPRDEFPVAYTASLAERFPGERPTAAGYHAWLAAGGTERPRTARLYAASLVRFPSPGGEAGHPTGDGWLPEGTITAISGPLR
ncbi:hypothetical protein [Actinomadura sp. WMMB 499]|uniref:hypothetical protein n=1 Tax=Actinomadura sp. WMMB 499 TaxID=1219491 RepID=UPI0012478B36|nr:hypothetical protein [Actinomadura sp. WMMB 499]QFG22930.1 hypothetical protein F7P10_19230 [Actinomadura sp. WMMB 499]